LPIRLAALFLLVTVTGLSPPGTRGLVVEVKTTVSAQAAVGGSHAFKRWLGSPGEGTLVWSEMRQELDDFIHSK
jgi:hypothetical protein